MKYPAIGLFSFFLLLISAMMAEAKDCPKREFRGAWLQTVYQDRFLKNTTEDNKNFLRDQLDQLQLAGINVVLFQVRPSADAFYKSELEPWSRFISKDGKMPQPFWDPLQFMIEECHARGMELHAWLNPYRVTTSAKDILPETHIYHKYPTRFITFDKKIYFDPGQPENREFITKVVEDIVRRYDVDGIHFDDYFYPYPVKGVKFNDELSYRKYGNGMNLSDWRRKNVDLLIEKVSAKIKDIKPWIRFGISPFGIWRNKSSDPRGSETRGLQNYDDLYADVIKWAKNEWIDYLIPQLYWTLENKIASAAVLTEWWALNSHDKHIYIGQNVKVTLPGNEDSQLGKKIELTRRNPAIQGNCWWSGFDLTANHQGVIDSLSLTQHINPALPPEYPWLSSDKPNAPKNVRISGSTLYWDKPATSEKSSDAVMFVVYHFPNSGKTDTDSSEAIACITDSNSYNIASFPKGTRFIVTAMSRTNIESSPSKTVTSR